jgi:hypothetical protein
MRFHHAFMLNREAVFAERKRVEHSDPHRSISGRQVRQRPIRAFGDRTGYRVG